MGVRPGYKQTEVGVIPEDWSTARLSALVERGSPITYGVVKPGSNDLDGVLFIRGGDIFAGKIEQRQLRKIPKAVSEKYKRTLLEGGEILVSLVGYPGEAAIVPPYLRGANIARQVALVRLSNQLQIFPDYICKFLQSDLGKRQLLKEAIGSAQQVINLRDIQKVAAVIPPTTSEQRAIAEALSDADVLIESLDQLIGKKRQIKQGAMQELLTGKRRLPGFGREWSTITMRDVLTMPATYGIVTAGAFIQNGVKMLRGGDIFDGSINNELPMVSLEKSAEYSRTVLTKNDVVIALVGYPGASAKIPDELIGSNISRAVGLLRLNDRVSPDYLVCMLNSPDGRRMVLAPSAGSAQQVVNLAALNKLQFSIPVREEQEAIASIFNEMDTELAVLESRLTKARQIKQGMMQELLTGRIRLI